MSCMPGPKGQTGVSLPMVSCKDLSRSFQTTETAGLCHCCTAPASGQPMQPNDDRCRLTLCRSTLTAGMQSFQASASKLTADAGLLCDSYAIMGNVQNHHTCTTRATGLPIDSLAQAPHPARSEVMVQHTLWHAGNETSYTTTWESQIPCNLSKSGSCRYIWQTASHTRQRCRLDTFLLTDIHIHLLLSLHMSGRRDTSTMRSLADDLKAAI